MSPVEREGRVLQNLRERGPRAASLVVALGLLTAHAERVAAASYVVDTAMEQSDQSIDLRHPKRYCDRVDDALRQPNLKFNRIILGPNGAAVVQAETQDGEVTRWTVETTSTANERLSVDCRK